jgi:hypothetical protein
MDNPTRSFFWAISEDKRKYHFVRWRLICKPNKKGGMGLKDLTRLNISLMCKWWWKIESVVGPWHQFMRIKYLIDVGICNIPKKIQDNEFPLFPNFGTNKNFY